MAYPAFNLYWGRRKFDDAEPPMLNPYPAISSLGLKHYLRKRIELDVKNKKLAHELMRKIPADTGAEMKEIQDIGGKKVITKPIGGTLADEPSESKGG